MNRKVRSASLVLVIAILLGVSLAFCTISAHILVVDGPVGAVLHIDPDDEAIARAQSTLHLMFQGVSSIDMSKCNCTVRIMQASTTLLSLTSSDQRLHATPKNLSFDMQFQSPGPYTLKVSGTPQGSALYPAFALSYDIQVGAVRSAPQGIRMTLAGHWLHVVLFGFAIGFGVYLIITDRLEKRAYKKNIQHEI